MADRSLEELLTDLKAKSASEVEILRYEAQPSSTMAAADESATDAADASERNSRGQRIAKSDHLSFGISREEAEKLRVAGATEA